MMFRLLRWLRTAAAVAVMLPVAFGQAAAPDLSTLAERTGFRQTGRYDEVVALCAAYQRAYPAAVQCTTFGRTPEGRPMLALVATRTGATKPETARARHVPVLLVQGGIHAGEIDGKDAGFLSLRAALDDPAPTAALRNEVLVFVPVFNVDGHERFGAWNRPNQRGPEAMGWRTTAQNLNLNRDYMKADAPEMQAMLGLVNAWDPLVYVDLHVTDGAQFEHDVSITAEPVHAGDPGLQVVGRSLRDAVIDDLAGHGSLPLPFYPSFVVDDDPASGFVEGVPMPRFSHGYFQLRNRIGILVETHSWKDYPTRVRVTRVTVDALIRQVADHGAEWRTAADAADRAATGLAGMPMALAYRAGNAVHTVDFRGYAYTRVPSAISGGLVTHYDERVPQTWHLPLRDEVVPDLVVTVPGAGYIVPAAHAAWVGEKLAQHGIVFRTIDAPLGAVAAETFRADKATFATESFEGHQALTVAGRWQPETRDVAAGALFVPVAQTKLRLVMALLEPQAPDALLAWGRFNTAFEQKEYMEAYVAEGVAQAQLAADPALAATFAARLASDPAFAASPPARLAYFARRHPSWDERFDLYPVLRVDKVPPFRASR